MIVDKDMEDRFNEQSHHFDNRVENLQNDVDQISNRIETFESKIAEFERTISGIIQNNCIFEQKLDFYTMCRSATHKAATEQKNTKVVGKSVKLNKQ